jgi:hypothetical protein
LEGLQGLPEVEKLVKNRPLGHRRVRQDEGQRRKRAAGLPEQVVEQLDDLPKITAVNYGRKLQL